jgi:hypothetical protein
VSLNRRMVIRALRRVTEAAGDPSDSAPIPQRPWVPHFPHFHSVSTHLELANAPPPSWLSYLYLLQALAYSKPGMGICGEHQNQAYLELGYQPESGDDPSVSPARPSSKLPYHCSSPLSHRIGVLILQIPSTPASRISLPYPFPADHGRCISSPNSFCWLWSGPMPEAGVPHQ